MLFSPPEARLLRLSAYIDQQIADIESTYIDCTDNDAVQNAVFRLCELYDTRSDIEMLLANGSWCD
jgi:hypothetical protein